MMVTHWKGRKGAGAAALSWGSQSSGYLEIMVMERGNHQAAAENWYDMGQGVPCALPGASLAASPSSFSPLAPFFLDKMPAWAGVLTPTSQKSASSEPCPLRSLSCRHRNLPLALVITAAGGHRPCARCCTECPACASAPDPTAS